MNDGAKRSLDAVTAAAMREAEHTYVFEQTEVRKTGRTADTQLRSGKKETVVEITPVDPMVGSWKKWVKPETLFVVQQ